MKVKAVKPSKTVVRHESFKPKVKTPFLTSTNQTEKSTQSQDPSNIMNMPVSQLWSRMKSQVNSLHAASLSGRQLVRHNQQQLVHLGAHPRPREVIPAVVLRGQRNKAKRRKENEQEKRRMEGGAFEHHVVGTEQFGKKHVQNKGVYGLRPAEELKIKAKEERLRKYRK